jgi:hypothetical protein
MSPAHSEGMKRLQVSESRQALTRALCGSRKSEWSQRIVEIRAVARVVFRILRMEGSV